MMTVKMILITVMIIMMMSVNNDSDDYGED